MNKLMIFRVAMVIGLTACEKSDRPQKLTPAQIQAQIDSIVDNKAKAMLHENAKDVAFRRKIELKMMADSIQAQQELLEAKHQSFNAAKHPPQH